MVCGITLVRLRGAGPVAHGCPDKGKWRKEREHADDSTADQPGRPEGSRLYAGSFNRRHRWKPGKSRDAFPSGHAMHVGAMASAATVLPSAKRNLVWSLGAALVTTRVVLLAHWASDVAAGLLLGGLTERLLRFWTGYGQVSRR